MFGPQKGADPEMIRQMDGWLEHFATLSQEKYPAADPLRPGTGAAGGLGFAFLGFTKAVLESGVKIVLDETKLEDYVSDADLVITGEGRLAVSYTHLDVYKRQVPYGSGLPVVQG